MAKEKKPANKAETKAEAKTPAKPQPKGGGEGCRQR